MIFLLSSDSGSLSIASSNNHIDIWRGRMDDIFNPNNKRVAQIKIESVNDIDQMIVKLQSMRYSLVKEGKGVCNTKSTTT